MAGQKTLNAKVLNKETGHEILISSALTYPEDTQVYQDAKAIMDKHAARPKKAPGEKNPFIEKYGKFSLNAIPKAEVDPTSVEENFEGDINSHWVIKWKDPKTGRTVAAYTRKFMEKNAKVKWKRIAKFTKDKVEKIKSNAEKLMLKPNKDDPRIRDGAAVIGIIARTGLRPGSEGGFGDTGNRGVSTLGPQNVTIDGDKVTLNFRGKSYQDNNAEFTDPALARYLEKKVEAAKTKNSEFIFDVGTEDIYRAMREVGGKDNKVKDLRTFTACEIAKDILYTDDSPPPPLPDKPNKVKKAVKDKLNRIFDKVAEKLNNTRTMAKNSYVHPEIVKKWLEDIGVEPQLVEFFIPTLNNIKLNNLMIENETEDDSDEEYDDSNYANKISINPNTKDDIQDSDLNNPAFDDVDEYPLPTWWDNDKIQLVPIKKDLTTAKKKEIANEIIKHNNPKLKPFNLKGITIK
jgi:DNA topoisomerase-1